ncbi:hypothetical protein SAMN05421812_107320 [Asanoa hainanensis]|uniref:Lipoprotein n=1 Tax=Asanoa hainanensis TaxID=560556 RepID=A0A239N6B9_9ACTN|nr:hypothetical protein [Asanoa hainanensis]SNT50481.1 hypothetical protein SAMN05421812_107320 [Asanoa hainanensis]
MKRRLTILAGALVLAAAGCSTPAAEQPPAPAATVQILPRADGAPSAQDVVDAFAAAGLPVPAPRDNTAACASDVVRCSELVTTDAISVYVFPDETTAAEFATADTHRAGVVVLSYATAHTPESDRPAYESTLTSLL